MNTNDETYPGTDMLIRLCYGCQERIPVLEEAWVDMDESVVVCETCKQRSETEYQGTQFMRPSEFTTEDINAID